MISYKGNKKAANRKGLAAHDRSDSYFFYWLFKFARSVVVKSRSAFLFPDLGV